VWGGRAPDPAQGKLSPAALELAFDVRAETALPPAVAAQISQSQPEAHGKHHQQSHPTNKAPIDAFF